VLAIAGNETNGTEGIWLIVDSGHVVSLPAAL